MAAPSPCATKARTRATSFERRRPGLGTARIDHAAGAAKIGKSLRPTKALAGLATEALAR